LHAAYEVAKQVGLKNVYVYDDKGCDCAMENLPVSQYLDADPDAVHQVKKCAASCCGEQGVLLKKYESK
jgi:pyruvate formate lyase activating enzyme